MTTTSLLEENRDDYQPLDCELECTDSSSTDGFMYDNSVLLVVM